MFIENDCTMIVNSVSKEEDSRKNLVFPHHVADIVSVGWISKENSLMKVGLPEANIMMVKEIIWGGYEIGKGLEGNLQGILDPMELLGKNDTFGVRFEPTAKDKQEMQARKKAKMEGKQITVSIPPLRYTFLIHLE